MALIFQDKERRIVPRWREFSRTCATTELLATAKPRRSASASDLERCRLDWNREKNLGTAADFVSTAVAIGMESEASEPAKFVLSLGASSPAPLRVLASRALGESPESPVVTGLGVAELQAAISMQKKLVRLDPRRSIAWADLARYYEVLGQRQQARSAMECALRIAPSNRFVVRSAARMYVHHDEYERAHTVLKRCARTAHDPWLMAAEIAVACVAHSKPLFYKDAKLILDRPHLRALHLSELRSAIATLEYENGNAKRGRKLAIASLEEATENAIAQAAWIARMYGNATLGDLVPSGASQSYEATFWNRFRGSMWADAMIADAQWLNDEPFSSRPATMGSFVASVALGNDGLAERISRRGLQANPTNFTLRNNLIVSLARQGKLTEAEGELNVLVRGDVSDVDRVVAAATTGLLYFRKGDVLAGRALYRRAIQHARELTDPRHAVTALLFLAEEETHAGTPEAQEARRLALGDRLGKEFPELEPLRRRLEVAEENRLSIESRNPDSGPRVA